MYFGLLPSRRSSPGLHSASSVLDSAGNQLKPLHTNIAATLLGPDSQQLVPAPSTEPHRRSHTTPPLGVTSPPPHSSLLLAGTATSDPRPSGATPTSRPARPPVSSSTRNGVTMRREMQTQAVKQYPVASAPAGSPLARRGRLLALGLCLCRLFSRPPPQTSRATTRPPLLADCTVPALP